MPEGEESLSAFIGKLSNQAMRFETARVHRNEKKIDGEKAILRRLHNEGFTPATQALGGILYKQGHEEEAKELFKQAAHKGLSNSMYSLAKILWKNARTIEDKKEAKQWLAKAGEKNHRLVLYDLGYMTCKEGNIAKGKAYFEKASELGCRKSIYLLGGFAHKAGQTRIAQAYFKKAKEQGYVKPPKEDAQVTPKTPSKRDNVEVFIRKS